MKKAVLYKNKIIKITEEIIPKIQNNQCLIKVSFCGICSSDIDRIHNKGAYFYPITLGHEISGIVTKIGSKITDFKINDKVAIFPLIPCKKCKSCKETKYNQCKNYKYYGSRNDGGYSEYISVYEWNLFKISRTVDLIDAALLEPLSVCFHAINQIKKLINIDNKKILILGAGFLGLIICKILKSTYKNNNLTIVDKNIIKLNLAKKYSDINKTYNSFLKSSINLNNFDIVIEATGNASSFVNSINFCNSNGIVLWMGNINKDLKIPKNTVSTILRKELIIIGTWNSNFKTFDKDDWKLSLKLLEKSFTTSEFISHKIRLSEVYSHTKKIYEHKNNIKKFNHIKSIIYFQK